MVNTILKEADLFCPNSVRINFTIYRLSIFFNRILKCPNGMARS
ncbi:ABC transporter ATP-binding protein [Lactiplantibacillus plantarum]|nr:ABC transporter ATP-binding protein [Lactiplantibacillus plantarum]